MRKTTIPDEIKESVLHTIERFNLSESKKSGFCYLARFQGKYLYLDQDDCGNVGPICRLEYKGTGKPWGFAIYKYSSERYDPEECWFPGFALVDGTIEGALKAGMQAYS
jgi:hypothetical protein